MKVIDNIDLTVGNYLRGKEKIKRDREIKKY